MILAYAGMGGDDYNKQTPRRRLVLFRGVLLFFVVFSYFSSNLFGGIEIFRIFANDKGCAVICHPEYITTKKLQILRNTLKLNLLNCTF